MEWIYKIATTVEPVQYFYGIVAIFGGVARYLNSFANGQPFSFGIFLASAFVAGFSGWMFALVGISLSLPQGMVFMMAGTGGFFGEQTMKLVLEFVQAKTK